jgi:endonuclease/exonuclease/phosphatase (EEP) superfamily protein YafD
VSEIWTKWGRPLFGLAARGAALLALAVALAAQGGAFDRRLDAFNSFAPLWLIGTLGALAAVLLFVPKPRRTRWVGMAAAAALLQAAVILPEYLRPPPPLADAAGEESATQRLKVVSFNVWSLSQDEAAAEAYLRAQDADIVFLQEAHESLDPMLDRLAALYPYRFRCTDKPGSWERCSTMILAKAPIREPRTPTRNIAAAIVDFPEAQGGPLPVVSVHLPRPLPSRMQERRYRFLLAQSRAAGETAIVGGDFNTTPWSFRLRWFDRESGLARLTRARFTWPAPSIEVTRFKVSMTPFLPIDHLYVGRAWRLVNVSQGPESGSDHLPVAAIIERDIAPRGHTANLRAPS